jgi:single-strand DNA-binding protein
MADVRVPDLNKVIIAGRLTRDPELKYISSGRAVCRVSIANSQYFKGKDGERRESTTFVDVSLWDKQAEWVGERLKKGRPVLVEGRLKSDSWEDKNTGQKRSKIEISAQRLTPLDWDDDGRGGGGGGSYRGGGGGGGQDSGRPAQQQAPAPRPIEEPIPEDDIPF